MDRSPRFGSISSDNSIALWRLALATVPVGSLNQATTYKSPAHSSKGTRSAPAWFCFRRTKQFYCISWIVLFLSNKIIFMHIFSCISTWISCWIILLLNQFLSNKIAFFCRFCRIGDQKQVDSSHCLKALRFHILFQSPLGVLFTFPSRYYFAIGHPGVFSLARWSLLIHKGFHVPHATRVRA